MPVVSMCVMLLFRYVFWIDCCERPHVGRAGMDGQGQIVIVDKEIYSPSALTIDYTTKRIYWSDDSHILFANMDGSQRHKGTEMTITHELSCNFSYPKDIHHLYTIVPLNFQI